MSNERTLSEELEKRELIAQVSAPSLATIIEPAPLTMYVGFDPTATSLHLGHLLPVMVMAHFQRAGHRIICLVGGATGMVGDPSGRSSERNLLTPEQVAVNVESVKVQLSKFLKFDGPNPAVMVDNNDWISKMSFIDWLRDVGKHFKVNTMLAKESVKQRLGADEGISFTEFSYQTMQAYDFYHLFAHEGCTLQGGGNDQWGNITAGIDLIHRICGEQAHGVTFPLVTTAAGEKFGKSAGNAIWLDSEMVSPYRFYQYWIQSDDRDVKKFSNYFTFATIEEIDAMCVEHDAEPQKRIGQRFLAEYMTELVHGPEGLAVAQKASDAFFGGSLDGLSDAELLDIFDDVPSHEAPEDALENDTSLLDCLVSSGAFKSKGEVRRLVEGGGLYVANNRVESLDASVASLVDSGGTILVLRKGKKNYSLIRF